MGLGGTPKGREARRRRSLRLRGHDYAASGGYFVTICSRGRACLFGGIDDGAIYLSPIGEIVSGCWLEIPQHFPDAELDEWIVMPNHIHGILILHGRGEAFASRRSSAPQDPGANASPLRITKARGTRRTRLVRSSRPTSPYPRGESTRLAGHQAVVSGSATTSSTLFGTMSN